MTPAPHSAMFLWRPSAGAGTPGAKTALQAARAAIARWRGGQPAAAVLPRGLIRLSPQACHLRQAQRNLAAWRALGGFAQDGEARLRSVPADACME